MQTTIQQDKQATEPDEKPKPPMTKEEQAEWFKEKARTDLVATQLFRGQ